MGTFRFAARAVMVLGLITYSHPAWAQISPEEELTTLQTPPGFEVSLFASEPMITNPSAIDVDTHGRIWVAEIQWYRAKAKNPPADKIKVLEDTDGDGKADKVTVFAEGLFAPMSICVAGEKVYVATSPDLWVYEDKDGDLKADGPPKKLLTGFGGYNHDHGAHSLVLGPDHKWWMSHGDTGFNVTGTDGSHIEYKWGAMLRGELDGSKLETVAVNFRNPYELCVSSFGESYCSDNDNDGNQSVRICWIMEGGNYGWFGSPPARVPPGTPFGEHWHFRGHIPGYVPATLVTGFGSPSGICFYEGDAFGPKYKNAPLHTDCGPREVRLYRHEKSGYGMKANSEVFLANQGDDYFRPDDICAGPDGRLYISDWYDGGVGGHAYNNPDQGRIFVLRPAGKKIERPGKPGPYSNTADAIEGLKNPNLATQYLAREKLLADGEASIPALVQLLTDSEPNYHARALWVLDRLGGNARQAVFDELHSPNAAFRALAVRILRRQGNKYADAILTMSEDASSEVRREVLLALPAIRSDKALDALTEMTAAYDGADRYQLEAINIAANGRKEQLYARLEAAGTLSLSQLPLLQLLDPKAAAALLMNRLAASGGNVQAAKTLLDAAGNMQSLEAGRSLVELVADNSAALEVRKLALDKLLPNLGGSWKELSGDKKLTAAVQKLLHQPELQQAVAAAIGNFGLRDFGNDILEIGQSNSASQAIRVQAIAVAAELKLDEAPTAFRKLLDDRDDAVRRAALSALVELQDPRTLRAIFAGSNYSADVRQETVEHLMQSTGGALALMRLLDANAISTELKDVVIAKAAAHPDSNVRVLYERFVPEEQRPKKLGSSVKPEEILALPGDASRGRKIFVQSSAAQCKSCHTIDGSGGALGPDLSLIGKKYERKSLLETILNPSKAIAPEYVPYLLETTNGQVYAGFLVERTKDQVLLRDVKNQLIRAAASEVEALIPQEKSLMPELVLRDVSVQDAADLLAFLTTLRQATQQVGSFRVLGPFDMRGKNLDTELEPEKLLASPDLMATYAGLAGQTNRWEVVTSDGSLGFAGIDSVKYDRGRGLRAGQVAHYFLVYAESPADQRADLLIGSDDGCKVWANGKQIHRHDTTRPLAAAQDSVSATLRQGRNAIVIKVVNASPPGGVALAVRAGDPLRLTTE